jgi:tRNA (guanine10-N2)-dimethyltransferase
MNILFELSKEHSTLPQNEIFACLNSENISYTINEKNNDILNISTNTGVDLIKEIVSRLSYIFYVDELFFSCSKSINEIKKNTKKYFVDLSGSIAIRYTNRSKNKNCQKIIEIIEEIYTKNKKVNLTNPDNEIRVFITDSKVYVGKKIIVIDRSQYEKRRVQFRPYFSPISLHPKIARALVNLSGIRKDEILLDPFCGTGGILLEAGLIGAKVIGSDIEEKMIYGSKESLDFYKLKNYQLFCSDIGDIKKFIDYVDAIVTDLPYGIATTTKGENMNKLYMRTFEVIAKILKEKKKAVIGISDKKYITKLHKHLKLIDIYEFRAHKSLTRYFAVFEKQP